MAIVPNTSRGGLAGVELDYVAVTSDVSVTAANEATATVIVTGSAVTYDGATTVLIEFYAQAINAAANAAGNAVVIVLYEDGASLGPLTTVSLSANSAYQVGGSPIRRRTPSAGSHTYSIRAYRTNANSTVVAGAGGSATSAPAFIRITRV